MKYIFLSLSVSLGVFFVYDLYIKHESFNDRYYMLIISGASAIAWLITLLIERRKRKAKV
jgi:hypothetical protein